MKKGNRRLTLWLVLLAVHTVITVLSLWETSYLAIFQQAMANWTSGQVLSDLTVSLIIISVWMLSDARKRGVAGWPFVLLMLPLGSFAPLFYLVRRDWAPTPAVRVATATP